MYSKLIDSPFFKGFSEKEIQNILDSFHYQVHKYNRNELIFLSGDHIKFFYIVVEGVVAGEMVNNNGKIMRIESIHAGKTIAPAFLFADFQQFPVNVIAETDCKILSFSRETLMDMMEKNPRLMMNMINIISGKTQFLALKIKSIFLQTIRGKIALYLLDLSNKYNDKEFKIPKTQNQLAHDFNVTRPSVARVFSNMKKKNIIEVSNRKVKIIDELELMKCVNKV